MSELIEQLAKEHSSSHHIDETRRNDCHDFFEFTPSGLEAFTKAYQAAAPIDNVREVVAYRYKMKLAGEWLYMTSYPNGCEDSCPVIVEALIPSTQANRTEAAREQS
jgi:hypothetical protein